MWELARQQRDSKPRRRYGGKIVSVLLSFSLLFSSGREEKENIECPLRFRFATIAVRQQENYGNQRKADQHKQENFQS
jgi:hypothetical protein